MKPWKGIYSLVEINRKWFRQVCLFFTINSDVKLGEINYVNVWLIPAKQMPRHYLINFWKKDAAEYAAYSRNFNQLEIMRVKIKWDPRTEALGESGSCCCSLIFNTGDLWNSMFKIPEVYAQNPMIRLVLVKLIESTIIHKIFETNSSFHVK